jgi:hypothetical protein
MYTFRDSRRVGRHPVYQTPPYNAALIRGPGPTSPLDQSHSEGGHDYSHEAKVLNLDMQQYGYSQTQQFLFNNNNQLILPRPTSLRIFLLLQNNSLTGNILYNFGAVASAQAGISIVPGGNLLLDKYVDQGDLNVYGNANTSCMLQWANSLPFPRR